MAYAVKEAFYTLQGEGARAGRASVFCRFAGCNLWTGHEADRAAAVCQFCDTQFVGTDGPGGGRFASAGELAAHLRGLWPFADAPPGRPYVVCTGGEPLLQLDPPLVSSLREVGFEIAVETNGTRPCPEGIDWICVSPKAGAPLVQTQGHELKLVYPQPGAEPERFESLPFTEFFLQPMDGPQRAEHTRRAVDYCLRNPQWRISLQTHKLLGIP
ncbi:MAG: 7-carboxy-7-deazaguanine synthase [Planctomycetaceae bacterium]